MNLMLCALGFHSGDAAQAEKLCDWIFQLNGNRKTGHVLLAAAEDVHPEMQMKVKLAAEVAFDTVDLLATHPTERMGKTEKVNSLFAQTAMHIFNGYRVPWVWIEPDCVPLKSTWLADLSDAYYAQPRRYMGSHMMAKTRDSKDVMVLARVACYPAGAMRDLEPYFNGNAPFNMVAEKTLVERSTKSRLIQQIAYHHETDHDKIRPDALMLHSDKTGALVNDLRAALQPKPATPENGGETVADIPIPKRRGRPPLNRMVTV
jgi:hypothetical protein